MQDNKPEEHEELFECGATVFGPILGGQILPGVQMRLKFPSEFTADQRKRIAWAVCKFLGVCVNVERKNHSMYIDAGPHIIDRMFPVALEALKQHAAS